MKTEKTSFLCRIRYINGGSSTILLPEYVATGCGLCTASECFTVRPTANSPSGGHFVPIGTRTKAYFAVRIPEFMGIRLVYYSIFFQKRKVILSIKYRYS